MKKLKSAEESQLAYIPEEVVGIILSKLPSPFLLRYRCVSQLWRSLIIQIKFNISYQSPQVMVLSEWYQHQQQQQQHPRGARRLYSIRWIDGGSGDYASVQIPKPSAGLSNGVVRIRGSCNGLLLLSGGTDLFLWNPLTGCCKKGLSFGSYRRKCLYYKSGLCYDSSADDYKVLMLFVTRAESGTILSEQGWPNDFAVVGSFKSKSWTQIDFPFKEAESGPVVNGNLHWIVSDNFCEKPDRIIYFDPTTNGFVRVGMAYDRNILGAGVLEGCLSVTRWVWKDNFEVLAMKEYGEPLSWTRLFSISIFTESGLSRSDSLVPLCFTKDGQVLIQWAARRILVYNPEQNLLKDFPMQADANYIKATVFADSLDSPASYCCQG